MLGFTRSDCGAACADSGSTSAKLCSITTWLTAVVGTSVSSFLVCTVLIVRSHTNFLTVPTAQAKRSIVRSTRGYTSAGAAARMDSQCACLTANANLSEHYWLTCSAQIQEAHASQDQKYSSLQDSEAMVATAIHYLHTHSIVATTHDSELLHFLSTAQVCRLQTWFSIGDAADLLAARTTSGRALDAGSNR